MTKDNTNRFVWLGGRVLKLQDATINVLSPTAQFGANVFEGIRCYWNESDGQLYAFRLSEHHSRLKKSMKVFRMEDRYTPEELRQGIIDVVKANDYREDIAVRQTVFIDGFGSWNSTGPVNMFIAPIPQGRGAKVGLKGCISSWVRISDRNLSPKVKVGANYINSRMAQLEALSNGYDTAIFMNEQGKVAEAPGSCIFIVRDGILITPPVTASILESITRATVIELARSVLNLQVVERDIDRTELYICDEAFLCGSAMEIMPLFSVDGMPVKSGAEGDISRQIRETYQNVVHGKVHEYQKWLTPIY